MTAGADDTSTLSTSVLAKIFGVSKSTAARDFAQANQGARDVRGRDGKLYPIRSNDDRMAIVAHVHSLRHGGVSVRGVVAALDAIGIHRSVGAVHADLRRFTCRECSGGASGTPEQKKAPVELQLGGGVNQNTKPSSKEN